MPFSVDGHTLTVIEADGISVVPVPNVQQVNVYRKLPGTEVVTNV
jgi:hypothetical protein